MKLVILCTVIMFLMLEVLVQLSALAEGKKVTAMVSSPAPAFTLEGQNGNKVSLSDSDGKIDYKFSESDLKIELTQTSGIPFVKSNEVQVRVWR